MVSLGTSTNRSRGNGIDTIHNYSAGSTRFSLTAGLMFTDLTIAQDGNNTALGVGVVTYSNSKWPCRRSDDPGSIG